MPPHPGPASTLSVTSRSRYGIGRRVSESEVVVGGRAGIRPSREGSGVARSVEETEDDLALERGEPIVIKEELDR